MRTSAYSPQWHTSMLQAKANNMVSQWQHTFHYKNHRSLFWQFYFTWKEDPTALLQQYQNGTYSGQPLQKLHFKDHTITVWSFQDRLMHRLLLQQIKSTFPYVIAPNCYHLKGPSGVKPAIQKIQRALATSKFQFMIRADVKGYYTSIQHDILIQQLQDTYDDPRLQHYFEDIVSPLVDDHAQLLHPTQGLPRRSTLSPFFGAIYLTPLDRAFEKRKGVVYARFMDDIVILTKTKRQYVRAKRILAQILDSLKLKLSPHKTKKGFEGN